MYLKNGYSFLLQTCETCYTGKRKLDSSSAINKHVRSKRHQNGRRFIDALTKGSTGKDDNENLASASESSDSGSDPGIDTYEPHSDSESKESESEVELIEDKVKVRQDGKKGLRKERKKPIFKKKNKKFKNVFKCSKCEKQFDLKFNFKRHMATHAEKTVSCIQCDMQFSRNDVMRDHYNTVHLHRYSHECPECGKTFRRPGRLNLHLKSQHKKKTE